MKSARLFVLLFLVFPLSAQKKEVLELQRDVAALSMDVKNLQQSFNENLEELRSTVQQSVLESSQANRAVAVMEGKLVQSVSEALRGVTAPMANINSKLEQIANEFQAVSSSVADMNTRMQRLQAQIKDLDDRIKLLNSPPIAPPSVQGGSAASPGSGPPLGATPRAVYDNARKYQQGGDFDSALQEYGNYLKWYPKEIYAPDAQYYIGEIYYNRGDLDNALSAFEQVITNYPDSTKAPNAMYMRGTAMLKMGRRGDAKREFQDLLQIFPTSSVASQAKQQLRTLGSTTAAPAGSTRKRKL